MFREMLRFKQAISREECVDILKNEARGVLSVLGDEDYPYGMPINHYYCEEDGRIYFHGGKQGHKIDALRRHDKASFCVYDQGVLLEGKNGLNIRSVIAFGRLEIVEDREHCYEIMRRLCRKFTDDEDYIENEIRHAGPNTLMFAMNVEHMTGKLVNEF